MPLLSYSKIPGAQGMFALLQNVKKKKKATTNVHICICCLGFKNINYLQPESELSNSSLLPTPGTRVSCSRSLTVEPFTGVT